MEAFWKLLRPSGIVLSCLSMVAATHGQDYERYKPLSLDSITNVPTLPAKEEIPVGGSDEILVDSLDAIIVLDQKGKVELHNAFADENGLSFNFDARTSLIYSASIRQIFERYLGQPITLRRLNELSRDIITEYRRCGQPVVDVQIPEQKITSGTVQIVVIESRIGHIIVQNAEHSDACLLRENVTKSQVGCRIYESSLREDLYWLNRSPFRRVDLDMRPGSQDGTTDILFNVNDVTPIRAYFGYEDTGVPTLGRERLISGLVLGNLFGRDGTLGYQYTADGDLNALHAHALSYSVDFDRQWSLLTYGSWASSSPLLPAPLTQSGESWQAGLAVSRYFERTAMKEQSVSLGVDFKSTDNSLEFGTTNVSGSVAELFQLRVGYDGLWRNPNGNVFSTSHDVFIGPGAGFSSNSSAANFSSIRANTDPSYFYYRGSAKTRVGLGEKMEFRGRFTGQLSNDRLLFSETLGVGGYDSVRGLDQRTLNGDAGWIMNLEYGPNPWTRDRFDRRTSTRVFAFTDMGQAATKGSVPGEIGDEFVASAGVGLRYSVSNRFNLRLDYGHVFSRPPGNTSRDRIHLGIVILLGPDPS